MLSLLIVLLCVTLPLLLVFFQKRRTNIIKPGPPGPRGLPIIGNLHQLDNSNLHQQFLQLSKIYGPIFSLKFGKRKAIVISSAEIAKVVLKNNDLVFSNRPNLFGQQKLSYNGLDIVFSPYNNYLREIRKLCIIHLFSAKRVSSFSSIRKYEVKQMMRKIYDHAASSNVTNLSELLFSLFSTTICRIAFGRRYDQEEGAKKWRFDEMLSEFEAMVTTFFVSDYIPFLGWIDSFRGLRARLERFCKVMDKFCQEIIDEHMDPNRQTDEEVMVDVLLKLKKQCLFPIDLSYDHIKGVLMDMLVAGTGTTAITTVWAMTALIKNPTTAITTVWAMTALIKNPRVMKKVQEEIRNSIGKKDFLEEDDLRDLPYLKAVIKETFRLFPAAPLVVPRESNKSCTIAGFLIPAKTILYVNVWAIHRDPNVWKDPEEFYPERFLDNSINFLGRDFDLIPFGAGCRICPGIPMAIASLELILANLLYSFDWGLPHGLVKEDIDTEMLPGLAQHKKNHLVLQPKIPI